MDDTKTRNKAEANTSENNYWTPRQLKIEQKQRIGQN